MSHTIYDLADIITGDRVLASLKHAQDTNALVRFDVHANKTALKVDEDVELMWEVTDGDYLSDKDNTLGYGIDYITAIFTCVVTKSETTLHSRQAVLTGIDGIKVEVDTQSIEGDLYLRDTTNLSLNDFKQTLEQVEAKQALEDWLQPTLCFPKSK